MLDTYKIPVGSFIRHPDSLVLSIMDRYNFPPCTFNTVFATEYGSDVSLPAGKLYWQTYKYRQKNFQMKEIVIRSDSDVVNTFWLPRGKDDYVTESEDPDLPADYRRTLYRNPDVKTDSTGVAHVEFYNNSTCRFLSISAEGITGDGTPVVYEK